MKKTISLLLVLSMLFLLFGCNNAGNMVDGSETEVEIKIDDESIKFVQTDSNSEEDAYVEIFEQLTATVVSGDEHGVKVNIDFGEKVPDELQIFKYLFISGKISSVSKIKTEEKVTLEDGKVNLFVSGSMLSGLFGLGKNSKTGYQAIANFGGVVKEYYFIIEHESKERTTIASENE